MKKKVVIIIQLIAIAILVVAIVVLAIKEFGGSKKNGDTQIGISDYLNHSGGSNKPSNIEIKDNVIEIGDEKIELTDAEQFYEDNGVIVKKENAAKSDNNIDFKSAQKEFSKRGFENEILADFTVDGEYYQGESGELDEKEKYSSYISSIGTENGDSWVVYYVNGKVMAVPESYNMLAAEDSKVTEVIFSESDSIIGYDVITNTYYETIPDSSLVHIITVDKIDIDLLTKYTVEEIKKHENIK